MRSYTDALMNVNDLMELDYVFAKVMLYMCPHNDLVVVLQTVDPILASKFYIWYVKNHGQEYINKAKDPEVSIVAMISAHNYNISCCIYVDICTSCKSTTHGYFQIIKE